MGDHAMLKALLSLLKDNEDIVIHSSDKSYGLKGLEFTIRPTIYDWTIFDDRRVISRVNRLVLTSLTYLAYSNFKMILRINGLENIVADYQSADLIVFVGGGYLRTQKGLTQSLNLIMNLLLFQFAKKSRAKKIIAPISFGPFAYRWQERLSANVLHGFDLVAVREKYSHEVLGKYKIKNLIKSVDLALFLDMKKSKRVVANNEFILGFTIRKWLSKNEQEKFEQYFIDAIVAFSKGMDLTVLPIVQVDAPEYGDFDFELTLDIAEKLRKENVKVRPIKRIKNFEKDVKIYGEIDLLLGMRMHSNILAAIQGTPFVAISYEYKTEGIATDLGVAEYCIKVRDITYEKLHLLLKKASENRIHMISQMEKSLDEIRSKERKRWAEMLNQYAL